MGTACGPCGRGRMLHSQGMEHDKTRQNSEDTQVVHEDAVACIREERRMAGINCLIKIFVEVSRSKPGEVHQRDRQTSLWQGTKRTEVWGGKQDYTQRQWSEPKYLTRWERGTRRTQCGKSNKIWDGAEDNVSEVNVMIGLYDKNSDKLYAAIHAQLLTESM